MAFTQEDEKQYIAERRGLRAFCLGLTKNPADADDLCQQAMLRAWDKSDSFAPGTNMRGWLFMIAVNQFRSNMRRNRIHFVGTADEAETLGSIFDTAVQPSQLDAIQLTHIIRKLGTLPADQRDALVANIMGHTNEQIASEAGVPVGTVKSRAWRGRQALLAEDEPTISAHNVTGARRAPIFV